MPITTAMVLEESEAPDGRRVATVKTDRGDEYSLDVDATLKAVAILMSDRANEKRFGWSLGLGWYAQECDLLASRSRAKVGASA